MAKQKAAYLSYLMRLWQNESTGAWHGSLEDVHTNERHIFVTVEQLIDQILFQTILKEQPMSQGVMVIMQGFPKVEALSLEAKFDSESATELLREKLKDGYLKWKAHKERESVAKIFSVKGADKHGINLLFGPSRQSMTAVDLMTTANSFSLQLKEQKDSTPHLVMNYEG